MKTRSNDAEICWEQFGAGPDVVLLHAFPLNRELWRPVAERLATRYRITLIDLRAHGDSGVGQGSATMEKHAADLSRVCDEAGIGRAIFGGVSIGGYVLMEFWRRERERIAALILANTRAETDADELRVSRVKAADDVEKLGPAQYVGTLVPRILAETTRRNRPDVVAAIEAMARKMTAPGIAAALRGMATRPDSTPTMSAINVPTLLVFGEEDQATPATVGEMMQRLIPNATLQVLPRAGHVGVFEQAEDAHQVIRAFLEQLPRR